MNLHLLRKDGGSLHVAQEELTPYCMVGYFRTEHMHEQESAEIDAKTLCGVCLRRLRHYYPDVVFKADRDRTEITEPKTTEERIDNVFEFIVRYKAKHDGNSPSMRQILEATDITTTSIVSYYLDKLEDMGRIRLARNGNVRSVEVIGATWRYEGV